jgi:hypothetical protein
MTHRLKILAVALLGASAFAAVALPAAAGVVTIDSRPYQGIVDTSTLTSSAGYVAGWQTALAANPTAPTGYSQATVADWNGSQNNQSLAVGGGVDGNLAFFDQATFTVTAADAGTWAFQLGVDFGLGGTLIVDNTVIDTKTANLWWGGAGNYGNTSQLLAGSIDLGVGTHTLKAYGFEDCCDGGTGGQFLAPGTSAFQDFTTSAGGVPEPATWGLMIVGFGGLGAMLRRKRAVAAVVAA